MRKLIAFLSIFLVATASAVRADEVKLVASAPSVVQEGARFQVSYTLNTNASSSDLHLPDIDGLNLLMGPSISTSTSFSSYNGKATRTSSTVYTYVFLAQKEGTVTIAPATITVDGNRVASNPLTIKVQKGAPQASAAQGSDNQPQAQAQADAVEDVFVTQTLSKSSVYQGEAAVLTTRIYTRVNIKGISDVKMPTLSEFVTHDLDKNQQISFSSIETVNGKDYHVAVHSRKVLIPQKSGTIKIEPVEFVFVVEQRMQRRTRSIFDIFDDVRMVEKNVRSKALTINVKPLPLPQPQSFAGAVGNFRMNASLSQDKVSVDDGVTVRIDISGEGNFRILDLSKLTFHNDFDTFDPSVKNNFEASPAGAKGSKTFEYLIIPRHAGTFTIPAIEFSFFNPATGRYETLSKGPFTLEVEKNGDAQPQGAVSYAGSGSRERVQYLGKDMRYVRNTDEPLRPSSSFLFGSMLFVILSLLPVVLFVVLVVVYRKRIKDNADITKVRNRKANKVARKRLKTAQKLLRQNQHDAFYDELMRAMWGYLSDKLSLPLSDLTKDNAKAEMIRHQISDADADEFMQMLDACEYARYAPSSASDSMESQYSKIVELISKIEDNIR